MKADNTKKREYIEPQIEYIAFVYAVVLATSGDADTGDDCDWENGFEGDNSSVNGMENWG